MLVVKNLPANAGDAGRIPRFDPCIRRSSWRRKWQPIPVFLPRKSLGWKDPLEQEIANDSSFLAWEIPRMEEPGGIQSIGVQRVGHSRVAAAFSSYDGDLSLPLGLALGSPIFPSGCEGKLGVALESLQGRRDLT